MVKPNKNPKMKKKKENNKINELEEKRRDVNNRPKRANNTISNMFKIEWLCASIGICIMLTVVKWMQ